MEGTALVPTRMKGHGTLCDVLCGWLDPNTVQDAKSRRGLIKMATLVQYHEKAALFAAIRHILAPPGTKLKALRSNINHGVWGICRELYLAKCFLERNVPQEALDRLRDLKRAPPRAEWAEAFGLKLPPRDGEREGIPLRFRPYESDGGELVALEKRIEQQHKGKLDALNLRELLAIALPLPTTGDGWGSPLSWFCMNQLHHAEVYTSEGITALATYLAGRVKALGGKVDLIEFGAGNGRLSHLLNATGLLPAPGIVACDPNPVGDLGTKESLQFKVVVADDESVLRSIASAKGSKRKPAIVLSAWMTMGHDLTPAWQGIDNLAEYVLIGELGKRQGRDGAGARQNLIPSGDYDLLVGNCCYSLNLEPKSANFERVLLPEVSGQLFHIKDAQDAEERVPRSQLEGLIAAVSFRRRSKTEAARGAGLWVETNHQKTAGPVDPQPRPQASTKWEAIR